MTSPIRPTMPGAPPLESVSPERDMPRAGRTRAAADTHVPAARRQRVEGGRIDIAPRQALPLRSPPQSPDASLASMGRSSDIQGSGRIDIHAPIASLLGTPAQSLASLHTIERDGNFHAYMAALEEGLASATAAQQTPSHASVSAAGPESPALSGASVGGAHRAASLHASEFDPAIEYHPELVQAHDSEQIEKLTGLLLVMAEGASYSTVLRAHQSGLLAGFDYAGQLQPPESNYFARLIQEKLDRLSQGDDGHRLSVRTLKAAMSQVAQRVHRQTIDQMRAVMDACAELRQPDPPSRASVVETLRLQGRESAASIVRHVVLARGIFKAPEHADESATGLRSHVAHLAAHGGAEHAAVLNEWRDFEVRQREQALEAALNVRRLGPQPGKIDIGSRVSYLEQALLSLQRLEAGEKSLKVWASDKLDPLHGCFDKEGGLTAAGFEYLEPVRQTGQAAHIELVRDVERGSSAAVQAARERSVADIQALTAAVRSIKQGDAQKMKLGDALSESWRAQPQPGRPDPGVTLKGALVADAWGFRNTDEAHAIATKIRQLGLEHEAVAALRAALIAPHVLRSSPGFPDPIPELLSRPPRERGERRAAAAEPQAPRRHAAARGLRQGEVALDAAAPAVAGQSEVEPAHGRARTARRRDAAARAPRGRGRGVPQSAAPGAAEVRRSASAALPVGSVGRAEPASPRGMSPSLSAPHSGRGASFEWPERRAGQAPPTSSPSPWRNLDFADLPSPQGMAFLLPDTPSWAPDSPAESRAVRLPEERAVLSPPTSSPSPWRNLDFADLPSPQGMAFLLPDTPSWALESPTESTAVRSSPVAQQSMSTQRFQLPDLNVTVLPPALELPELRLSGNEPSPRSVAPRRAVVSDAAAAGGSQATDASSSALVGIATMQWLGTVLTLAPAGRRTVLLNQAVILDGLLASHNFPQIDRMATEAPAELQRMVAGTPHEAVASELIRLAQEQARRQAP